MSKKKQSQDDFVNKIIKDGRKKLLEESERSFYTADKESLLDKIWNKIKADDKSN